MRTRRKTLPVRRQRNASFFGILEPFKYTKQRYARHEQAPYDILHVILPVLGAMPFRRWSPPPPTAHRKKKNELSASIISQDKMIAKLPLVPPQFEIRYTPPALTRSNFLKRSPSLPLSMVLSPSQISAQSFVLSSLSPRSQPHRSVVQQMSVPVKQIPKAKNKAKQNKLLPRVEDSWPSL